MNSNFNEYFSYLLALRQNSQMILASCSLTLPSCLANEAFFSQPLTILQSIL